MREIDKYEHQLEALVKQDKSTWGKFAELMEEIENRQLYKELGLNSFTAWLKDFALKNKIHESVLWNRKKAGKMYHALEESQKLKGNTIAPLAQANISMDSLVLVEKISRKSPKLGVELGEKLIDGEITRDDLRTAYKTIRDDTHSMHNKQSNTSNDVSMEGNTESNISDESIDNNVTAAKIVQSLNNPEWLGVVKQKRHFKGAYEQDKYKSLTEFPVYTGTSSKSRRVDVLVAENLRCDNHFSLNLHAIEIKVSKSDFLHDNKYTEYAEFANYLWIAVPESLISVVEENAPHSVGILSYCHDNISIHREAELLKPTRLQESLTTLSLRLI